MCVTLHSLRMIIAKNYAPSIYNSFTVKMKFFTHNYLFKNYCLWDGKIIIELNHLKENESNACFGILL